MRKIYALALLLSSQVLSAQDVHFSQYWATPMAMNPAMCGKFNGLMRFTFDYRNQWFTVPTINAKGTYQTYQASVDANVLPTERTNNRLGVGLMFFNDKAGDGALQTNTGMLSLAYHQSLSRYGHTHLSLGLQAGIVSKRINMQSLIFETQLSDFGWNQTLPNQEPYSGKQILYGDVTIGALVTSRPKQRFGFNIGYSLHHLSQPRESFLGDPNNRLPMLHVVNGGCEFTRGYDNEWTIAPTFLFMMQANATQFNIGLGLNYRTVNENIAVFGGAYVRGVDAAILNLGVDVFNTRMGVSYDINYSDFRAASKAQGAIEVSVVYIFRKSNDKYIYYDNYCPIF